MSSEQAKHTNTTKTENKTSDTTPADTTPADTTPADTTIELTNNTDGADIGTELISLVGLEKDEVLSKIKDQLFEEIKEQCIDKPVLIKLITRTMEIVETTSFKGSDQKDLVIDVLVKLLETDGLDCPNKSDLIIFLKDYATNVIDIIVDASRGKFNINKIESLFTRVVKILFACLKKKA